MTYIDTIGTMGAEQIWLTRLRESDHATLEDAWAASSSGAWMLWLAERCGTSPAVLSRAASSCARTVLPVVTDGRVEFCINTLDRWIDGHSSVAAVMEAADSAHRAARRARMWTSSKAAWACWSAAYAAATSWTGDAAWCAANAAENASPEAGARHAEIVRALIPCPTIPTHPEEHRQAGIAATPWRRA